MEKPTRRGERILGKPGHRLTKTVSSGRAFSRAFLGDFGSAWVSTAKVSEARLYTSVAGVSTLFAGVVTKISPICSLKPFPNATPSPSKRSQTDPLQKQAKNRKMVIKPPQMRTGTRPRLLPSEESNGRTCDTAYSESACFRPETSGFGDY